MAVASLAMDPVVSTSAELMYQGRMPTATQLRFDQIVVIKYYNDFKNRENPDLQSHL